LTVSPYCLAPQSCTGHRIERKGRKKLTQSRKDRKAAEGTELYCNPKLIVNKSGGMGRSPEKNTYLLYNSIEIAIV
jgi:hypothetical protein